LVAKPTEAQDRLVMGRKIAVIHRKNADAETPTPHY